MSQHTLKCSQSFPLESSLVGSGYQNITGVHGGGSIISESLLANRQLRLSIWAYRALICPSAVTCM